MIRCQNLATGHDMAIAIFVLAKMVYYVFDLIVFA
jgi:hypothetical protein